MGRRRISIEKIQKKEALNVAFSKRRTGLFKKAEKLCRLCGAEIAIIVFSPGNKPYVFGYPNAEAVIDRFSGCDAEANSYALAPAGEPVDEEVDRQHSEASGTKEAQEEVGGLWWEAAIQGMGLNELKQLNDSLEESRRKMVVRAAELLSMDIESCVGSSSTASVELVKSEQ